jgi:GNAT superfamily N-acetyltransferase
MREAPPITIRTAQLGDAAELARLSVQLGYSLTVDEMKERLAVLLPNERHCIAVAMSGARMLGRAHVEHSSSIEEGERAELKGLVVDADARRGGVGRKLVEVAEGWALSRGLPFLIVRSNVVREIAHPFYLALGYSREKTQHYYRKALKVVECRT